MNHFLIVTNTTKDPGARFTGEVCRFLQEQGAVYCCDPERTDAAGNGSCRPEEAECILVLGGDGTVLQAAGKYYALHIPFLGINLGTLGYLAEIEKANWKEALKQLLQGCYTIEQRMMIEGVTTGNAGDSVPHGRKMQKSRQESNSVKDPESPEAPDVHTALNDIVIARSGALRIMHYDVRVNGQFLCTYNADGIIVSTPTGSTAYNLSAGGPIVEPGAEMIVLTPICPHQMNIRPIVLSAEDRIEIAIGTTRPGAMLEAEADFDGNDRVELHTGDTITIQKSSRTTKLVKVDDRSFLETLHKKMS